MSTMARSGRLRGALGPGFLTFKASRRFSNIGESPHCPGPNGNGPCLPSTTAWILLGSPPRDLPMAWSEGSISRFLSFARSPCVAREVGAVLVGTVNRGIHRNLPVYPALRLGMAEQGHQDRPRCRRRHSAGGAFTRYSKEPKHSVRSRHGISAR